VKTPEAKPETAWSNCHAIAAKGPLAVVAYKIDTMIDSASARTSKAGEMVAATDGTGADARVMNRRHL
jgi:hypothetical protein